MEKMFAEILKETSDAAVKAVTDNFINDNIDKIKTDMANVALVGKTEYSLIIDIMFDEWAKRCNIGVDYEEVEDSIFQALKIWAEADGVFISKDEYDDSVIVFRWPDHLNQATSLQLFGGKLTAKTEKSIDFLIDKFPGYFINEVKKECMGRAKRGSYEGHISTRYILSIYLETDPERNPLIDKIYKEYKKHYIDYIFDWCNKNGINIGYNSSGDIKLSWAVLM